MIIKAYGIHLWTAVSVSAVLERLNVTHVLVCGASGHKAVRKDYGYEQPALPIVIDEISNITRYKAASPQILYVCDSYSALEATNLFSLGKTNINESIRNSLLYALETKEENWQFQLKQPTVLEYVENATKPQYLNSIQTEIYRITPYKLRKEVQHEVIEYLNSDVSQLTLMNKLKSSYKLDSIANIIRNDPKTNQLRSAIAEYKKTGDLQGVATKYDFDTFEILFIINSAAKNKG